MNKVCIKCELEKPIIEFPKRKESKDGHRSECKLCIKRYRKEYNKRYYKDNKNNINTLSINWAKNNSDKVKISSKRWRDKNKDKIKTLNKKYKSDNKDFLLHNRKQYVKNNPEKVKQWEINRRLKMSDLQKITISMRNIINKSFTRNGYTKISKSQLIIGCSFDELKKYIESKFETWMTWENRGLYNGDFNYGWDIDHIIPLSSALTEEDVIRLNHYTNLQPLCSKINRDIKSNLVEYIK